jgi:hypothetical protein
MASAPCGVEAPLFCSGDVSGLRSMACLLPIYLFTKVGPLAHPQGAKQGSWGPKQTEGNTNFMVVTAMACHARVLLVAAVP